MSGKILSKNLKKFRKIELTQGKFALVDLEDYKILSQRKWRYHSAGYAVGGGNYYKKDRKIPNIYMHREILQVTGGVQVDHINGNRLDNRKSNLRICTQSQNKMNTKKNSRNKSGYKGVAWHKSSRTYQAYINFSKKFICLGYFHDPKKAAIVYNTAAKKYFGDFAKLNNI